MQRLPQIRLDTTLAELYAENDRKNNIALILGAANSEVSASSKFPRNTKYLYQDSTFSKTPEDVDASEYREIQRNISIKYLSLVPQHDAFAAGNMSVILFDPDLSDQKTSYSKKEAEKTISSLIASQRPNLLVFTRPKQIAMEANDLDLLASKMEFDELEEFPTVVDLDMHYFLNSKAALCTSGLPIPKSELIELEDFSADPESCCLVCKSSDGLLSIPSDCTGIRGQWLKRSISHILLQISERKLPFVLKNQQTFGGGGTFMVSTSEELSELKKILSTRTLPKLLSQVNAINAHLKPATLILSEMITNPIGDWGLTFFVKKTGEAVYLAATQQVVDFTKAWIGSTISYTRQEMLKQKFTPTMQEIGTWLRRYGYYGPCGADILEVVQENNQAATLLIVDLNVRTSGSLVLGLMKGHFLEQRGLHEAMSFSVTVKMTRESFIDRFRSQFQDGRIVIVSWFEDVESVVSYGNLVIGGEDKTRLEKEIEKVKEVANEICF